MLDLGLESWPPATGLRKPESSKVPRRVLGRVPGKRALLGGLLGAVLFCCFSKENGLPALLPAVPPAVPFFQALFPTLSPQHFWGFGLPLSCSRRPTGAFYTPQTLRFKGNTSNFDTKNAIKLGKALKGQMVPWSFSRVHHSGQTEILQNEFGITIILVS